MSVFKKTSMVRCLCCLHNWLIDNKDDTILLLTASDRCNISNLGGRHITTNDSTGAIDIEASRLNQFLDAGNHNNDTAYRSCCNHSRDLFRLNPLTSPR